MIGNWTFFAEWLRRIVDSSLHFKNTTTRREKRSPRIERMKHPVSSFSNRSVRLNLVELKGLAIEKSLVVSNELSASGDLWCIKF